MTTKLEELIKASKNQDINAVLMPAYNDSESYSVIKIQEGSLRGKYQMGGQPVFANEHFRVTSFLFTESQIVYELVRTESDLVTSIWVNIPEGDSKQ